MLLKIFKKLREADGNSYLRREQILENMPEPFDESAMATAIDILTKYKLLQQSGIFKEVSPDKEDFERFEMDLSKNKIFLQGPDKYVLYIAQKQKVDHVVTFDLNVVRKINVYRKKYEIKYMKPLTTVSLMRYLHMNNKIKFSEYLRVVLEYFKYVEMNNLFVAIKDPYRGWDINTVKERFQLYRDPLLGSLRDRVDGAQTRVDMYG